MIPVSDLVGVPFVRGGFDPSRGLDCLGLVLEVLKRAGRPLRVDFDFSPGWRGRVLAAFEEHVGAFAEIPRHHANTGDLVVVYDEPGEQLHVAVMLTRSSLIHATKTVGVAVQKLARFEGREVKVFRRVD